MIIPNYQFPSKSQKKTFPSTIDFNKAGHYRYYPFLLEKEKEDIVEGANLCGNR